MTLSQYFVKGYLIIDSKVIPKCKSFRAPSIRKIVDAV